MNSITELLDLEDTNIIITDTRIEGTQKTIVLETVPEAHYCPSCSFRMHSKGIKNRKPHRFVFKSNLYLCKPIFSCINNQIRFHVRILSHIDFPLTEWKISESSLKAQKLSRLLL